MPRGCWWRNGRARVHLVIVVAVVMVMVMAGAADGAFPDPWRERNEIVGCTEEGGTVHYYLFIGGGCVSPLPMDTSCAIHFHFILVVAVGIGK